MDFELMRSVMSGDDMATRMYCGSYTLVIKLPINPKGNVRDQLYRCKGDIPVSCRLVKEIDGKSPYDKDGFLLPKFWSLPWLLDSHE